MNHAAQLRNHAAVTILGTYLFYYMVKKEGAVEQRALASHIPGCDHWKLDLLRQVGLLFFLKSSSPA